MKSTMKSAFAIIAVALMIMVAVVPMVGVVDGDASKYTDPESGQATTDKITLTFNLYANNAKITDNTYSVKVTWGKDNSIVLSTNSGVATKEFDETKMTGAKATVGKVESNVFTADSNFEVYTIGNVAAGANLSFDLKKGYAQTTSAISFYTKASSNDKVYDAVKDVGTTVYVNYDIYKNTGTAASPVYTKIGTTSSTAALDSSNSSFYVTYPLTESEVYVKVNKVTVGTTDIAFTSGYFKVVGESAVTSITADQYVFTVTGIAGMPAGKIGSLAGTDSQETPKNITDVKAIKETISATTKATFIYKLDASSASSNITYTATFGSVSIAQMSNDASSQISFTNKAVYGAYAMDDSNKVSAQDGLNLTFTIKSSEGTVKSNTTTAYVADGLYIAAVPTLNSGQTTVDGDVIAPASTAYEIKTTSVAKNAKADVEVKTAGTVGTTTYQLAYVAGTIPNATAGYTFTVSGASKTFGLKDNKVVCAAGDSSGAKFGFYTAVNEYISFTAQSGSTFTDASSGKYYIPTGGQATIALSLVDKVMKFAYVDGNGNAISTVTNFSVTVVDATGATVAKKTGSDAKTVTLADAALDVSKLKVYFSDSTTSNGSTFAAYDADTAIAYSGSKMTISTLETTYYIFLKDADGKIITDAVVKQTLADAYVAEDGTKIYSADFSAGAITVGSDGSYAYTVSKNYVNTTLTGVTQKVAYIQVANATGGSATSYIFDPATYQAVADSSKVMTIAAKADSLSATIYKTDKVTPIANTEFKLMTASEGSGTLIDVGVTDVNGKITFTSDAKITSEAVIVPTVATGLGTITKDGTTKNYVATNNIFTVSITDADGKAYAKPTGTFKLGNATGTITNYVITVASDAKAGDILAVELKSETNAVRTFDKYTLTADDIKNGTISLVSNESTYTVSAVDADGKAIVLNTTDTKVKTKQASAYGDITASANVVYKVTPNSLGTKITYVITAPADGVEYVADIVGSNTTYGLTAGVYYAFDEKNAAVAESVMSTITFELVDAVGASTLGGLAIGSFVITDSTGATNSTWSWISGTTKWSMIGDKDETYYVKTTPNTGSKYTFADQYIVDGKIKAKEQTVVFTAVDAAGLPINATFNMYKVASNGAIGDTATSMAFDQNGQNSIIMALSSTTTYKLVDSTGKYTFTTDGTKFTSAEQTVYFKFAYANGFNYPSGSVASVTVYYKDGTSYSATVGASVTLDTTNVASYVVGYTVSGSTVYFSGTTSELKCSLSKITGFAIKDSTYSLTATYLNGSTIVDTATATIGNNGKYEITPDFVNGGYDKVLVQCFDASGYLYSQATLDAKTGYVADLVPVKETAESLAAKIITNTGIAYDVAGGKVYLTAIDKISKFSDDGNYVETYKFAGWYVNGAKFTDDLNCAVDNVNTNVITASYVLDDSKELGKESASGISPTVLVIGIAAVIIALIAVVYAVIQKKE